MVWTDRTGKIFRCPKCKSTLVSQQGRKEGLYYEYYWVCQDCKHSGPVKNTSEDEWLETDTEAVFRKIMQPKKKPGGMEGIASGFIP